MGFSHKLGRECHSENCSENTPEFRELLREWPFHSESVFFQNWGLSQVSEKGTQTRNSVFLTPFWGQPVVCTLDSCGFCILRGFRVVSTNPALNPLACGCLNCLLRFHDSRRFHESHRVAKHRYVGQEK